MCPRNPLHHHRPQDGVHDKKIEMCVLQTTSVTEALSTWGGIIDGEETVVNGVEAGGDPSPTPQPSTDLPLRRHTPDDPSPEAGAKPLEEKKPLEDDKKPLEVEEKQSIEETKSVDFEVEETGTTEEPTTIPPKAQAYAPSSSLRVCPGVCVANRISEYCEAALDVSQLCRTGLRCCVSGDLFADVDDPPKEFVLLNPKKSTVEPELHQNVKEEEITSTERTTSSTTSATTTTSTSTRRTTVYTRQPISTAKPNRDIPQELRCKGTCVAGFFAFLCDEVDRSGVCPRGGRCCVTQRRPTKQKPSTNSSQPVRTTTTTTTTTTTPQTPPSRSPPTPSLPLCPGTCLPTLVSSFCSQPSVLVEASGCEKGTVCCDNRAENQTPLPTPPPTREPYHSSPPPTREPYRPSPPPIREPYRPQPPPAREPYRPRPPPERPISPTFETLASLFTRPPAHHRPIENPYRPPPIQQPPPPPRPPTTTTTTSTTTTTTTTTTTPAPTTEPPDLRAECPGTCIQPFLSFTCFGNAEMTDLFLCSKPSTECCSPKSALRDVLRYEEIQNTARNDTVLAHPFEGSYVQPYGEPGYEHNVYEETPFDTSNYPPYDQTPHDQSSYEPPQYEPHNYDHQPYEQQPYEHPPYEHTQYEHSPYEHPPYGQPANKQPSYEQPPYQPYQPEHQHERPYTPLANVTQAPSEVLRPTPESAVRNKYVCGVKGTQRSGRVVGGEDALPGEWCWQVALINSLNQYLCGGALIGTQWVLTAAHCVTNIVRSGDAIYVRVGDHDLTTKFGSPGAQTLRVATTYIHHNHNSQTLDNDIALLKLYGHADLKEGVCLVCLPARGVSQVAGNRCTVTGYGYMGETGPIPLRVREAEVPVVSDNECVRKINAVTEKIFILPASSFCAGGESGHDACQGDGGGPLVCNVDGYYELSGLVSWGFGCGRQDVPGVYVKVSSFIGWINQIISVNNL
nr:protein masquerade-like [Procambarus clarkii]